MPDLLSTRIGDTVHWTIPTQGKRVGTVVDMRSEAESREVDALMKRTPGEGLATFGRCLLVRCTQCPCNPNREGWLHAVSESQLDDAPTSVAATLFDLDER